VRNEWSAVPTLVGAPEKPLSISEFSLIFGRTSLIGGLAETQEMLDFCGKHHITSGVEVSPSRTH
jgi:alcohol dehydrogenase (NADP+)